MVWAAIHGVVENGKLFERVHVCVGNLILLSFPYGVVVVALLLCASPVFKAVLSDLVPTRSAMTMTIRYVYISPSISIHFIETIFISSR